MSMKVNMSTGVVDVSRNGEPIGVAFDALPTDRPLYLACRVCGRCKPSAFRIMTS